jgi:hypothetical protein
MTSYLYRLDVDTPPEWAGGLPDEVQDAVDLLAAPFQTEFATRASAFRMRKFWRRMGAKAEVVRSNPVTWPDQARSNNALGGAA